MQKLTTLILTIALLLSGCATYNPETNSYSDPAEGFNRKIFDFNYYVLDPYVVRPSAVFWRNYVPKGVRTGIINFSSNLSEPASMVNYALQGEGKKAAKHLARFFINTVIGLGGLIDVAGMADPQLKKTENRTFGNVLGYYHVGYGPYVMAPFYGPVTLREDGGALVDYTYAPLRLLTLKMNIARGIFEGLDARANMLDYEDLLKNSNDPYTFVRDAYFQRKDFLASDGEVDMQQQKARQEALQDVLDEIDSEDE